MYGQFSIYFTPAVITKEAQQFRNNAGIHQTRKGIDFVTCISLCGRALKDGSINVIVKFVSDFDAAI